MAMYREGAFAMHVPYYNLIQWKTLATHHLLRINAGDQPTNLWATVDRFDYSLAIAPILYFSIDCPTPWNKYIGDNPIQCFDCCIMFIVIERTLWLADIIDEDVVVIATWG